MKEISKFFENHQQLEEEKNCETKEQLAEEVTPVRCLAECKLKLYSYAVKLQGSLRIPTNSK